jgi:hypothetical protein
MASNTKGL